MKTQRINPGLLLTIALPLFAIVASGGVAVIAFTRGDPTLPDEYHWEGLSLDRDFAAARRAADLNVQAVLQLSSADGGCRIALRIADKAPDALVLSLVHGARPELDRQVRLTAVGPYYQGQCGGVPAGLWHVKLANAAASWSVREDVGGSLDNMHITTRPTPTLAVR